jgi:PUA domain protein
MRRHLRNQEIRDLIEKIESEFNEKDLIKKKNKVELVNNKIILVNNKPMFFYHDKKLIPTIKTILKNNFLKKVTVDMGAIKFVASGADIMRPGITEVEKDIHKNEIISIIDEKNKKPLAIGKALFYGDEIEQKNSGKVIENIHHVGDEIWHYE